jgi:hypothetical protein
MVTEVINKIEIAEAAVFDYECCIYRRRRPSCRRLLKEAGGDLKRFWELSERYDTPALKLDRRAVKAETERYIDLMNRSGRLLYENYIRCRYLDEKAGLMLMLFFYRSDKFGIMQNWRLAGICPAKAWSEDDEDDGQVRAWLKTDVDAERLKRQTDDWAVRARTNRVLTYTEKTLYENVLKEVCDEFGCERDKEAAERILLLQSYHFKRGERKRSKRKNVGN